jgi:7-cyano-7-deazaguanine reductase
MTKDLRHLGSQGTKYQCDSPSPETLDTFINKHQNQLYLVPFIQARDEFTSRCPVTDQPDFAKMEIIYVPNVKMVESKSLKLYFFSFRNSGEFHEDVTNRIVKDLWSVLEPKYLRVFGNFAPRGGIAIKPLVERWEFALPRDIILSIDRLVTAWDLKNG